MSKNKDNEKPCSTCERKEDEEWMLEIRSSKGQSGTALFMLRYLTFFFLYSKGGGW